MHQLENERAGKFHLHRTSSGEQFYAFLPKSLPPDPPLKMDEKMSYQLAKANKALGKLEGSASLLPNPELFIYQFVRKEAVLSAQIEGTQTTLEEFLSAESTPLLEMTDDIIDVSNYITAMNYGLGQLDEIPLSAKLIKRIHAKLLTGTRGSKKKPGKFRTMQNWIGGKRPGLARYVPPPAEYVVECMNDLEKYLNEDKSEVPIILKAGLIHAQFESIHPFHDGNGRLGRLLITFILVSSGELQAPLLYLSLYLKQNRDEYYERLNAVRDNGDWEGWMLFYLKGVEEVSNQAAQTAKLITDLRERDRKKIESGHSTASALQVLELFYKHPKMSVKFAANLLELSEPTVRNSFTSLEGLGILTEVTGLKRNREYLYLEYMGIIISGTEL